MGYPRGMAKRRAGYKIYVCGVDEPMSSYEVPYPDCPNAEAHARTPRGYLAWHAWAEKMMETHSQERCPGCQRYCIWTPNVVDVRDELSPMDEFPT